MDYKFYYIFYFTTHFVLQLQRDLGFGKEDDSVTHSFKVLGWVTLTQLFGSCIIGAYRMWNDRSKQSRTSLVQAEER